jgi:tellurite resistance protein
LPRSRTTENDIFSREGLLLKRNRLSPREIRQEADAAPGDDLLRVLVAAAAVIAHADGRMDIAERRKLIEAFTTSAQLDGFSVADLAAELTEHLRNYEHDAAAAERSALLAITGATISPAEARLVAATCSRVLSADGLVHPAELGALHRVQLALGLEEEPS